MIAGVAGGLAEYFEVDVALIRLLWLITFFMGGGFIAYLLAWFVIPERPTELSAEDQSTIDLDERAENQEELDKRWRFGGLVLIVAGLIFLLREILPWRLLGRNLLPVALIVVGLFILFNGFKSNKQG
jgi:phage shock protein PspC (stress-responsive transcriptional regulator)